ncbi:YfcC family protein [Algoriphagus machipongonensis]|uniref:Dicarboxylate transporter n=1 Tax=Algoriphagus machipongonensis TaxID=388413 RepID=A3HW93_9BACT|nr:Na+/H+ antiporter NhaC family protein [Algoriphagus machipongonensis]EAZ80866.1 putative dicarboxylate transporter [Algoriphagus machipongonensis]
MKKFPNAFVIILVAIIFGWILTFLIPKGTYQREFNPETEQTIVVPNSYTQQDAPHLSPFDLLLAIPRGIAERGSLIVLILLLGGCFYIIEKTGALNQGLNQLILLLKGKELLALITLTILFLAAGFTIAMQEEIIAMVPVLMLFGRSLGYNPLTILSATFGSATVGAAFSPFNVFGVVIAQQEAQLELLSGLEFRLTFLLIASLVWIVIVVQYARKHRVEKSTLVLNVNGLTKRSKLILSLLGITFGIVTYGLVSLGWGFEEMSACFFALGLVSGLIAKFGINKTTELYVGGFKEMIFACVIIGLANSISLVLSEGVIIDTIVHGLFSPLKNVPPSVSAVLMMFSQSILHFPIPSYSGQAILTMPILTPLSDLIGLSRQVTVLAYQYGTITMDLIVPTNGALMAVIALAGVKYNDWIKFIIKPVLIIFAIAAVAILIGIQIGYQ